MGRALGILAVSIVLAPATALALNQPDGTTIPVGPSLQDLFSSRGEQIDALADAAILPETYVPSCALTFEVLQRNAGYMNAFGWYNVTGARPGAADLHEVLRCTDGVGTVKTVDIKNDPAYAGGEIGFYQAVGNCATSANNLYVFFSQPAFNPDSQAANPTIHLLTYDSTVTPHAFYFGWEDLISGGDNDFDDLTTYVTGISCSGGGGACDTGQQGVCGDGTMQCQGGVLTCVGSNAASDEICDGLDNDCDGVVDDAATCPPELLCDRGRCVPPCNGSEFPCESGRECVAGVCVDEACVGVDCATGTTCVGGQCVAACQGVVCPYGQVCRVGACVDPCATLSCDGDQICELGVCVERCDCTGCEGGETCRPDGACVQTSCVGVDCAAGTHCAGGVCVDSCTGATCPDGEWCEAGQCVPIPAAQVDAGEPPEVDAGADAGTSGETGGGGGCCQTGTRPSGSLALALLLLVRLGGRRRARR